MIAREADRGIDLETALATVEGLATAARADGVVPALRDARLPRRRRRLRRPAQLLPRTRCSQRRRGLPIALATLALAVAGRVGAPLVGVGLPGHFVVADRSGAEPGGDRPVQRLGAPRPRGAAPAWSSARPACRSGSSSSTRWPRARSWPARCATCAAPTCAAAASTRRSGRWRSGLIVHARRRRAGPASISLLSGTGRYEEAEATAAAFLAARPDHPRGRGRRGAGARDPRPAMEDELMNDAIAAQVRDAQPPLLRRPRGARHRRDGGGAGRRRRRRVRPPRRPVQRGWDEVRAALGGDHVQHGLHRVRDRRRPRRGAGPGRLGDLRRAHHLGRRARAPRRSPRSPPPTCSCSTRTGWRLGCTTRRRSSARAWARRRRGGRRRRSPRTHRAAERAARAADRVAPASATTAWPAPSGDHRAALRGRRRRRARSGALAPAPCGTGRLHASRAAAARAGASRQRPRRRERRRGRATPCWRDSRRPSSRRLPGPPRSRRG